MPERFHVYPLRSAMHGAMEFRTRRWGYVCFKPPNRVYGRWWAAYVYLSPNGTPWASTFLMGRCYSHDEKRMARLRRVLFGHGYSTDEHDPQAARAYIECFAKDLPEAEGL